MMDHGRYYIVLFAFLPQHCLTAGGKVNCKNKDRNNNMNPRASNSGLCFEENKAGGRLGAENVLKCFCEDISIMKDIMNCCTDTVT